MEPWIPEIPTFRRAQGKKDGKERLYLLANNEADIDAMLKAAGLMSAGIHRQDDKHFNGYYRIIKKWEEPIIKKVFP
ncbi:hypothetical protein C0966_00675 [Bacillus methanolicus]|uniref:hypothetical protein n=1 Tax=Bacillus methanolicus TaxID=1471 RepID=UPI00237FFC58|nr:hypothetical protein [Bacillus methanolicus]MDE3837922.1 hypothetical protein [Bacillus methanolicus]